MPPFSHRFSEWSPEAEMLASAVELLQWVGSILIKANQGHPDPIARWPRPIPAAAAAREARKWERHQATVLRLLPDS